MFILQCGGAPSVLPSCSGDRTGGSRRVQQADHHIVAAITSTGSPFLVRAHIQTQAPGFQLCTNHTKTTVHHPITCSEFGGGERVWASAFEVRSQLWLSPPYSHSFSSSAFPVHPSACAVRYPPAVSSGREEGKHTCVGQGLPLSTSLSSKSHPL